MDVACDLIPLAVLKRRSPATARMFSGLVACDLIPLAVLKPDSALCKKRADGSVACDLIPLAVLKLNRRDLVRRDLASRM